MTSVRFPLPGIHGAGGCTVDRARARMGGGDSVEDPLEQGKTTAYTSPVLGVRRRVQHERRPVEGSVREVGEHEPVVAQRDASCIDCHACQPRPHSSKSRNGCSQRNLARERPPKPLAKGSGEAAAARGAGRHRSGDSRARREERGERRGTWVERRGKWVARRQFRVGRSRGPRAAVRCLGGPPVTRRGRLWS